MNPPSGTTTAYYYTDRNAFRLEGQKRTDFAVSYHYNLTVGGRAIGLYVNAQIVNLFNQFQLCGCGALSVFANGGNVALNNVDRSIRNNVTAPGTYPAFNPFTTVPVEGVHWSKGPTFGTALNRFAYTTPRTFRLSLGLRF